MMEGNLAIISLAPLSEQEQLIVRGGSQGWDHDIAHAIGVGFGYSVKKLWRLFGIISKGLMEGQENAPIMMHK